MSSRVIRKLHGDKNLEIPGASLAADGESDGAEDQDIALTFTGGAKKKTNINPFDLLLDESNSPSESEGQAEENHETEASLAQADQTGQDAAKRKKKKKRKKSTRQHQNARSSEDNVEDDEVERSVKEVNRILGEAAPAPSTNHDCTMAGFSSRKCSLGVEHKHLNPSNELKRIFGSKIIQAETRKKRNQRVRTLKSTWLVTAKENWPQIGNQGLSMKLLETKDGITYFTLDHNRAYQDVENNFLAAVESLSPDNIVAVMNMHPYHVNSLLQLSDICRLNEDLPMAAELVERALFALECAFHPSFNVALGTCRLDYKRQQNRSLYVALFKHILFVGGRACYRTALEFCKLLLALDPEQDPLAIILAMDFYALRAREYQWLIDFFEEWEPQRNLSQLPNFAFSVALAHFQLSQNGSGDSSLADKMLQDALIMFPGAFQQLLDKCSVVVDSKMSAHPFFTLEANKNESQALGQLIQLYVIQSYHVWKEPELLPWLQRNAHIVLDRVTANDPVITEAERKRGIRYAGTPPRNILRYIFLCDRKDFTPQGLPANQLGPIMSLDPLPPSDSIDLYTRPQRSRLPIETNVFTNFFRSLLPHFNIDEPEVNENPEEGQEDGGVLNDVTARVRTLMESVRDLMASLTHDSDANESEGDETDTA
ncbi:Transcription factor 25 [Frankliniella fusca]|uniref:Transcription factor 25 n=1 Tax=Frankliniella fusca TaxID=407009 RepID=A0AAE1LVH8_9NEOP|nr:Transcription factor 25 [Frankliniella fusca]